MIMTLDFWQGAGERALKTFLQTWFAVFFLGAAGVLNFTGVLAMPWETATATALMATLFSISTSVGNADFTAGRKLSTEPPRQQVTTGAGPQPYPARGIDSDGDGIPDFAP